MRLARGVSLQGNLPRSARRGQVLLKCSDMQLSIRLPFLPALALLLVLLLGNLISNELRLIDRFPLGLDFDVYYMVNWLLDSVKTRMQAHKYASIPQCIVDTYKNEGTSGFFRGVCNLTWTYSDPIIRYYHTIVHYHARSNYFILHI